MRLKNNCNNRISDTVTVRRDLDSRVTPMTSQTTTCDLHVKTLGKKFDETLIGRMIENTVR